MKLIYLIWMSPITSLLLLALAAKAPACLLASSSWRLWNKNQGIYVWIIGKVYQLHCSLFSDVMKLATDKQWNFQWISKTQQNTILPLPHTWVCWVHPHTCSWVFQSLPPASAACRGTGTGPQQQHCSYTCSGSGTDDQNIIRKHTDNRCIDVCCQHLLREDSYRIAAATNLIS